MWRTSLRWLILASVGGSMVLSQTIPEFRMPARRKPAAKATPKQPEPIRPLPIPDDAVRLALADVLTLPVYDRCYTRYLFDPEGDKSKLGMRSTSVALQYISRASSIIRPVPVAGGLLYRIDLRWYAPRYKDLQEWSVLWENLAFDPMFSVLITKDTAKFFRDFDAGRVLPHKEVHDVQQPDRIETRIVDHPGGDYTYPDDSGRTVPGVAAGRYTVELRFKTSARRHERTSPPTADVVRYNSRAIDPVAFCRLQEEIHSQAPVTEHRYFKARVLNSIKDTAVFKQVFGGLYYEFASVRKAKDVLGQDTKASDLDLFFEDLGIGSIKGGVTADQLFDKLRSDQGIVMFRSKVTSGPREVLAFHTPSGKESGSWGAISGDIKAGKIDIGDRVFANLLTPRRDAREAIFPKANGFLIFGLFNGDGVRQDEVPFDIAQDYTIPRPYHQRLQIRGCITCHAIDGKDGWQGMVNEAKQLIARRGNSRLALDIFDDRGVKHRITADVIDRLAGRYTGDFSKPLRRAQDDLAEATLKASGPWEKSEDQTDVHKLFGQRLHDEYRSYWWTGINAHIALKELGLDVPKGKSLAVFGEILPPDPRGLVGNVYLEDPRIAAIAAGLEIERADWALAYANAAERAMRNPIYRKLRSVR